MNTILLTAGRPIRELVRELGHMEPDLDVEVKLIGFGREFVRHDHIHIGDHEFENHLRALHLQLPSTVLQPTEHLVSGGGGPGGGVMVHLAVGGGVMVHLAVGGGVVGHLACGGGDGVGRSWVTWRLGGGVVGHLAFQGRLAVLEGSWVTWHFGGGWRCGGGRGLVGHLAVRERLAVCVGSWVTWRWGRGQWSPDGVGGSWVTWRYLAMGGGSWVTVHQHQFQAKWPTAIISGARTRTPPATS